MTYLKAFDEIRKTFAATHEAKLRNYGAEPVQLQRRGGPVQRLRGERLPDDRHAVPGRRADALPRVPGDALSARDLEVTYRGRNIAEVLDLTAREAFGFFRHRPKVQARLRPLLDVGLDYLRLGQPASTLSGGEAQRLKLASFLATSPGRDDPGGRAARRPSSCSTSRPPACTRPTRSSCSTP